eukprot:8390800-Pyramimonas_sp.AAC.1
MYLSRACAVDPAPQGFGERAGYPRFSGGKVGRRGIAGQSFKQPAICFWAHLSQSLWECRLSLARKSKVASDRAAAIVVPLAFK